MSHVERPRVLQVASSDLTVSKLLLPLIDELRARGYEVSAACSDGRFARELAAQGYVVHALPMSRKLSPWRNLRSIWSLYFLIRRERYQIVHVHTPIAAIVGRLAAQLAGAPITIYTAHGFYFHERMSKWLARLHLGAERLLGLFTDMLFTQSAEDAQTAVRERIAKSDRVVWISNGVDLNRFRPGEVDSALRSELGISADDKVIGFVGRLHREKGVLDLLEASKVVSSRVAGVVLLIVGDSSTAGDRDHQVGSMLAEFASHESAPFRIVFTGWTERVEEVMRLIDVFVLPSYREGMPRSIIEAMATGKPVVATDIRGCREEVAHGITGLLVPVADPPALGEAISRILSSSDLARSMGVAGRKRAERYFNEQNVMKHQARVYARLVHERLPAQFSEFLMTEPPDAEKVAGQPSQLPPDQKDAKV